MAAQRGRKPGFYVYRIFDGFETVYVGKGSGRRLSNQKLSFRLDGEILEHCRSDDHAFERERHWISLLMPSENKNPGGFGGRVRPRRAPRLPKEYRDIEAVGSRRYVARFLLTKLNERNCGRFGLSKIGLDRIREVANGPRC
jgi:hypothetical protein